MSDNTARLNSAEDSVDLREPTTLEISMMEYEKIDLQGELGNLATVLRNATALTEADKHNLLVDLNVAEWGSMRTKRIYSCTVLLLLALAQTAGQWERIIVTGPLIYPSQDPKYTFADILPTSKERGNIAQLFFNLPFIVFSLFAGLIIERISRRLAVSFAILGVSACVISMGFGQDYTQFIVLRLV